jgi:hypothetical protein
LVRALGEQRIARRRMRYAAVDVEAVRAAVAKVGPVLGRTKG